MADNGFGFSPVKTTQVKTSIDTIIAKLSEINSDLASKCETVNKIVNTMNSTPLSYNYPGSTIDDDFSSIISRLKSVSEKLATKVSQFYKINGVIKNGEIDYSSYLAGGGPVYTNAFDAVEGTNGLAASTYFTASPVDVYNTETGEYLHLTQDQLNDMGYLTELAENPNYALLLGNSVEDASGFIPLNGFINNVTITTNKNSFTTNMNTFLSVESLQHKINPANPAFNPEISPGNNSVSSVKAPSSKAVESLQHKINPANPAFNPEISPGNNSVPSANAPSGMMIDDIDDSVPLANSPSGMMIDDINDR